MYSVIILYGHSARTTCEYLNYVLNVFVIIWLHCTAQIYATCAWLHTVYCIAMKFSTMVSLCLCLFTDTHTHAQYSMLYNQAWVKFPWLGQTQTQSLKNCTHRYSIIIMVICVYAFYGVTSGWLYLMKSRDEQINCIIISLIKSVDNVLSISNAPWNSQIGSALYNCWIIVSIDLHAAFVQINNFRQLSR